MRWMGPFHILYIIEAREVKLTTLDGYPLNGLINESHLKPYYGPQG